MALPTASDNAFPSVLVTEGSAPSSPASGKQRVYIDSADHHLKRKTSAGAVTDLESGVTGHDAGIGFVIDGGGSTITTGSKGFVEVPFGATITAVRLFADQSGSITLTIKKSTYSGFPTTSSIVASAKPTLSTAQKSEDSTLTGWTTSITAGDVLEYNVDTVSTVTRVTVSLTMTKT